MRSVMLYIKIYVVVYISAYKTVSGVNGPLVILDDVKVLNRNICSYILHNVESSRSLAN